MSTDLARQINLTSPRSFLSDLLVQATPIGPALGSIPYDFRPVWGFLFDRFQFVTLVLQVSDYMKFILISLLLRVSVRVVSILVVITIMVYCPLLSSRGHP